MTRKKTSLLKPTNDKVRFRDVPQFTSWGGYAAHQPWYTLPEAMKRYIEDYGLDMNPNFQRGYVWTQEQKIKFVEYGLRGGGGKAAEWISSSIAPVGRAEETSVILSL